MDSLISPKYGGNSITPKAGFQTIFDASNLTEGMHSITVQELSRYGKIICETSKSIKIENKKYIGRTCIDYPTQNKIFIKPDDKKIKLQGWAVANDTNAKLQIFIDGNIINTNIERFSRPDVDNAVSNSYGGTKETPKAGFSSTIDISNYGVGKHNIRIRELSRYNDFLGESETCIIIENKKYLGKTCIDYPTQNKNFIKPDDTKINVQGWAVANDTNANLQIFIDGNLINTNIERFSRTDVDNTVSNTYGGTKETPKAGFSSKIDITNYSVGTHNLKVRELSRNSEILSEANVTFSISNKKYFRK